MKQVGIFIRFICSGILMLGTQGLEQPNLSANSPPPPPATGTPKGNSTPGTTRPEATCKQTNKTLTALNANNGNDFTNSPYPSFWFYVPYTQDDVKHADFLLLDGQEHKTIYHTAIKLAAKPGLIKITLPTNSQNLLDPNQNYRWYLMVNCYTSHSDEPDVVVDGWIQRKIVDGDRWQNLQTDESQKLIFYTKNNLWYDAVNDVAELHFQYPNDAGIQAAWNNLLKQLNKESVAQEAFVGSIMLSTQK
ncbi:DUF928 domain-containing protein [Nostoc sp. C052]|uniref:DUF928 domain-containing protein n=1 Tax=Nostoc sp. C052 TaxID=2576902 RepID=UPI0015C35D92|nr:DUF928 domain-containing protein [Nostoc sp. C052]QLE39991.1 DUF928 domain-containing protein [Nostoc sp. C052]